MEEDTTALVKKAEDAPVKTPTTEADEAAETAVAAITGLIIATLKESVPSKFTEAQKLCEVAQSLSKARGRRAADFHAAPQQAPAGGNHLFHAAQVGNVVYAGNVNAVNNWIANVQFVNNAGNVNAVNNWIANVQFVNNAGNVNANVIGPNVMMADQNVEPQQQQGPQENNPEYLDDEAGGRVRVDARALRVVNDFQRQHPNPARPRVPGRILFDEQGRLMNEDGILMTGHLDANALMRHFLMTFGPHAQTGCEANRARVAADEAVELKSLIELLAVAHEDDERRAVYERRIQQLRTNLERRSDANAKPEEEIRVVPADDPRGHPPGEGGPEDNDAPRLPAHLNGDAGPGGPPQARPVDLVGQVAVV